MHPSVSPGYIESLLLMNPLTQNHSIDRAYDREIINQIFSCSVCLWPSSLLLASSGPGMALRPWWSPLVALPLGPIVALLVLACCVAEASVVEHTFNVIHESNIHTCMHAWTTHIHTCVSFARIWFVSWSLYSCTRYICM